MNQPIETDVLIVGSGPAGSSSAALLSSYGIRNIMINRHGWLADTPRPTSPTSARWRCCATSVSRASNIVILPRWWFP